MDKRVKQLSDTELASELALVYGVVDDIAEGKRDPSSLSEIVAVFQWGEVLLLELLYRQVGGQEVSQ